MKINENILEWGIIIIILAAFMLSYKFSWIIYVLYIFAVIFMIMLLYNDIIFLKKNSNFQGRKLVVKVSYYGHLIYLLFIFNIIMHLDKSTYIDFVMDIFMVVGSVIYMPVNYKSNSKIIFCENEVYSPKDSSFFHKNITYDEIEEIHFIEYLKERFILNLKLNGKAKNDASNYKINKKDKYEIIEFINKFAEDKKIIESKEYKEDKLW